jgi:signal transduction histidine kinase
VFGVFAALVLVGVLYELPGNDARVWTAGACAVLIGGVAVLGPQRIAAIAAALAGAAITAICNGDPSNTGWFALLVLLAWCALCSTLAATGALWLAVTVLFVLQATLTASDPGWFAWIAGTAFSVLGCAFGRRQHDLVVQLRDAQAGLAQRAQAEERNRIARELHDVIAHSLTVSLLHVSSARLAVEHDPEDAARALADAERLTRQSLADVRVTVGLLRSPDDGGLAPPAPGLGDLPRLVEELRAAQADVSLVVDGDLDDLPATTASTVYRIVQESLTNAARHAPGSRVEVHVAARDGHVDVDIESSGSAGTGSGMGLTSMKERAAAVGGTLNAGPEGNGWLVHASLPRVPHSSAGAS